MMINTPNEEHKKAIEMAINKLMNYATEKKLMQDTFLAECVNDHENEDQTKIGQETNVLKQIKTDSKSENQDPLIEVNLGTQIGTFEWIVMSFGLKNAGATYQRAMNLIFHDMLHKIMEVYINDVVVKSQTFEEHVECLEKAFLRMRRHQLKMNPLKCAFGVKAGNFLGFLVHNRGIEID
jgi:hypothetical protein